MYQIIGRAIKLNSVLQVVQEMEVGLAGVVGAVVLVTTLPVRALGPGLDPATTHLLIVGAG